MRKQWKRIAKPRPDYITGVFDGQRVGPISNYTAIYKKPKSIKERGDLLVQAGTVLTELFRERNGINMYRLLKLLKEEKVPNICFINNKLDSVLHHIPMQSFLPNNLESLTEMQGALVGHGAPASNETFYQQPEALNVPEPKAPPWNNNLIHNFALRFARNTNDTFEKGYALPMGKLLAGAIKAGETGLVHTLLSSMHSYDAPPIAYMITSPHRPRDESMSVLNYARLLAEEDKGNTQRASIVSLLQKYNVPSSTTMSLIFIRASEITQRDKKIDPCDAQLQAKDEVFTALIANEQKRLQDIIEISAALKEQIEHNNLRNVEILAYQILNKGATPEDFQSLLNHAEETPTAEKLQKRAQIVAGLIRYKGLAAYNKERPQARCATYTP